MPNEIVDDSQIDNEIENFKDDSQEFDVREVFGLPPKEEESDEGEQSVNDKTPAKEDVAESKKRVVKFNKEDREIDESEVDELLQKGLALDKERERSKQSQQDLDRAAKLLGYKDHAALSTGLDALEKSQLKEQEDKQNQLEQSFIQTLVDNGLDEKEVREYLNNNPLIQAGRKAIEAQQVTSSKEEENNRWKSLYEAYPDLNAMAQKGDYSWATPELLDLAKRNDPLLAYEHLNKDKKQTDVKKQTEQKLIKQQQLSSRSKIETVEGEQENRASEELRSAFSMFGIDPKRAQKYAK